MVRGGAHQCRAPVLLRLSQMVLHEQATRQERPPQRGGQPVNPGVGWALAACVCGVVIVLPGTPRFTGALVTVAGWICIALAVRAWGVW